MSWRDDYQPGSFRGVPFRTESHERSGGRRVAVHEFPGRDEPVNEDLGRRARQFTIDCHVIGADYRTGRDALLDAIEANGPGLLVHPWHGRMMVNVLDYQQSESTEDGGVAWFTLTLAEAGQPAPSPVAVAAGADALREADAVIAAAPAALEQAFSIEDAAEFVEQAAGDMVTGMATISQTAAGLRGGIGPTLRAFEAGLRFLPANIQSLLRAPLNLGMALTGLVQSVAVLGGGGGRRQRLAPLELMLDWEPGDEVFPARTPQRQRIVQNRTALLDLFRTVTAGELVKAASATEWRSYEDAIGARDAISDRLDVLALAAADRGEDATALIYDRLRHALARDIAARGETLARVYRLQLDATQPALVLAHRLYADRGTAEPIDARADAIVARNRLPHAGFVPAGVALEFLTARESERRAA